LVTGPIGESWNQESASRGIFKKIKEMLPCIVFEFAEIGYNIIGLLDMFRHVKTFKPDFIYDRYITFNASCILAAKFFGLPIFLEVNAPLALERSTHIDEKLYFKSIAKKIEKWICSNATKTIVVSTPLSEYLRSIGVQHEKLMIMPNGADPVKFCPSPKESTLLEKIGAEKNDIIIGFTGVLRPWHGLELLIRSIGEIAKRNISVFLLIIGDGPIRKEIEEYASENGILDKLKITGRVSHYYVSRYLGLCDIAVSPNATFYASPMKVIEYMAMAKCVVVPNLANFKDIVTPGKTGEVFIENDHRSLTNILVMLCNDTNRRKDLGKNARLSVERRFNWEWNAREVCSLYISKMSVKKNE